MTSKEVLDLKAELAAVTAERDALKRQSFVPPTDLDRVVSQLLAACEAAVPVDGEVLNDAIGILLTMQRRLAEEPEPITGVAVVVAQAVDVLVGQAFDDDGHPYTLDTALALVLAERTKHGLPLPNPAQVVAALKYLKQQERE